MVNPIKNKRKRKQHIKTCNSCRRFEKHTRYCYHFKMSISDVYSGRHCKNYSDRRGLVRCSECNKLNKSNYCPKIDEKIPENQIYKKRECIFFNKKNSKKKKKNRRKR